MTWTPGDTGAVLIGVIVLLLGLEAYTLLNKTPDDHITAVVRKASKKFQLLPFLAGVLVGHFWWCSC